VIHGLSASIIPVINVLAVILIVMCTFAIFGATAYGPSAYFETFETSLYTMFVVTCLDGWTGKGGGVPVAGSGVWVGCCAGQCDSLHGQG